MNMKYSNPFFVLTTIATVLFSAFVPTIIRIGFSFHEEEGCHIHTGKPRARDVEVVPIVDAVGPESFAFDPFDEGPFTGVSNGRIIKWQENERRWIDFAATSPQRSGCDGPHDHDRTEHICGRPLGLRFNENTGDLYIADAYMGLLVVGPEGGLANRISTRVQEVPFRFTNALDIDQNSGEIYFTDSSTQYQRRNFISVILSGDKTGRLMKYDPETQQVTILLNNLSFPNGVALSEDGNFVVFAETTTCNILKYWLKTSKAGTVEVIATMPGFPDNIKRSPRGGFWVGIHSKRTSFFEWVVSNNWIGNLVLKLPINVMRVHSILSKFGEKSGMGVRLSEKGEILELFVFEDESGKRVESISEVFERKDGKLWIGSINMGFAGLVNA
ncbi:strictosidine synthase family protein [Tripterygium wilfordii]|uniref:Strictosidine synthase family protein n=1 Tax=Tripterygium wilfordii TaxID=458696 RepID=A0A7J7CU75_TRIWF|nr:protein STRICTOSIDINE SYNTHASE-LIKE 2-like isoform X2 [Tripterygium wilfordii]KAF5737647.1 strictosidine synthase family protein [Tripterygium wilfordii]